MAWAILSFISSTMPLSESLRPLCLTMMVRATFPLLSDMLAVRVMGSWLEVQLIVREVLSDDSSGMHHVEEDVISNGC